VHCASRESRLANNRAAGVVFQGRGVLNFLVSALVAGTRLMEFVPRMCRVKSTRLTLIAAALIATLQLCGAAHAQSDSESKARQFPHLLVEQSQETEVSPEDAMDVAFEMKKAAERADELQADGAKYCGWGKARVDASDLDVAISHLLDRGRLVPEHMSGSKMWRASFVATDLIRQLDIGGTGCALRERYSGGAHGLFGEYVSVSERLRSLTFKFDQLAARQTLWQEEANLGNLRESQQGDSGTLKVQLRSVLAAAREMMEAAKAAEKLTEESERVSGCVLGDRPTSDLKALIALIGDLSRGPNDYLLLASNMRAANLDGEIAEMGIITALQTCAPYAAEKKKARIMAEQALGAYHRLVKSIVEFEPLIVRQAEWEEQMVQF